MIHLFKYNGDVRPLLSMVFSLTVEHPSAGDYFVVMKMTKIFTIKIVTFFNGVICSKLYMHCILV